MKQKSRVETTIRYLIQGFFLVLITYLSYMHAHKGLASGFASIDTLCPFGGLETLYKTLSDGTFLQRVGMPAIILMIGTVVMALVIGRAFCGTICPLGTMQEWLYNIFGKVVPLSLRKKLQIPAVADSVLRWLKYILLFVIIAFTWLYHDLVFRPYDPWVAYSHIIGGDWEDLFKGFLIGFIVLIVTLLSTIILSRSFCKYLCPLGAFLGIFSKFSWIKINRNNATCTHCKICNKSCPMNVDIERTECVTSAECIECGSCVATCPVPPTLERKSKVPVIKWAAVSIPVIAAVLFLATYGIGKASGYWQTKLPIRTAADIKGSNNLDQIAEAAGVSVTELLQAGGLPVAMANQSAIMLKEFKSPENLQKYGLTGFEVDAVRSAFAKIRGETFTSTELQKAKSPAAAEPLSDSMILPATEPVPSGNAPEKSKITGTAVPAQAKSDTKSTPANTPETSTLQSVVTPAATDAAAAKKLIWGTDVKGSTTLKELLSLTGKQKSEFTTKFNLPADLNENLQLKELRDQNGKDMEEMKAFFGF